MSHDELSRLQTLAADAIGQRDEERTRIWNAVIAIDAIEHTHSLDNSGDLAERIERIGAELADRQTKLTEAFDSEVLTASVSRRVEDFKLLASAMRKMLPPALLEDVIAHLDPLTAFVAFLRAEEK